MALLMLLQASGMVVLLVLGLPQSQLQLLVHVPLLLLCCWIVVQVFLHGVAFSSSSSASNVSHLEVFRILERRTALSAWWQ